MPTATLTRTEDLLDSFLAHLLTPEVAERVLAYRMPQAMRDRVQVLGDKCSEGSLTPDERREYERFVTHGDRIALIKIKARLALGRGVLPTPGELDEELREAMEA